MDFGTHVLGGFLVAIYFSDPASIEFYIILVASVFPDLVGELFYQLGRHHIHKKVKLSYDVETTKDSKLLGKSAYLVPYDILHSLFALPVVYVLLGLPAFIAYALHVMMDLASHSKKTWGLKIFYPLSHQRYGVSSNWWEWKMLKENRVVWFNLATFALTTTMMLVFWQL